MISNSTGGALREPFSYRAMAKFLRIDHVTDKGSKAIGKLESGEVFVGREPGTANGITVENTAISRQHGLFLRGRSQWLFKDLGSTNGSWLNGIPLKAGEWKIIRAGDVIQLADSELNIVEERGPGFAAPGAAGGVGGRTLIVFAHDQFQDEYPVPEYGRAIVVGGTRGDLPIDGDLAELPTLVVERRGDSICAFGLAKDLKVYINGQEMGESVPLKDSDEMKVGQYTIVYGDPSSVQKKNTPRVGVVGTAVVDRSQGGAIPEAGFRASSVRGWANPENLPPEPDANLTAPRTQTRMTFGQGAEDNANLDETIAIDPEDMRMRGAGYDRHPSTRYTEDERQPISLEAVEDKVIIIIGFVLLVSLLALIVWWVFS